MKFQLIIGPWCLRFHHPDTGLFRLMESRAVKTPVIVSHDWKKVLVWR